MTAKSADEMNRPSLNVLLLPGATLPPYCGKSDKSGAKDSQGQAKEKLDEDIIVKEFILKDCGANFPDIDETEVTVLRTPVQNDEELKSLEKKKGDIEQCGDSENMTDCTDVLLLSRSQNYSADTSCQCELCSKLCPPMSSSYPSSPETNYAFSQPLVGCECERKARHELGEIIQRQQNRIYELEFQLCRQSDWHYSMQQKLNELYSEFGLLEPPSGEESFSSRPLADDQQSDLMRWEESEHQQNQRFETTEGTIKSSSQDNIKQP